MSTKWEILRRLLFVFILVLFVVYLWDFVEVRRRKNTADHLLSDLRQLQIGVSSADEIRRLSEKYSGHFRESSSTYELLVMAPYIVIRNEPHALPARRLWGMVADLDVSDNRLTRIGLVTGVSRSGRNSIGAIVSVVTDQMRQEHAPYSVRYVNDFQRWPMEVLEVRTTPDASSVQLHKAFDVKLSCFTSFFECRNVCDIVPSAWNDLPSSRLSSGSAHDLEINTECNAVKGPE